MMKSFNDAQSIVIRERLIHQFFVEFGRRSIRLILEDIIYCDATQYSDEIFKDCNAGLLKRMHDNLYGFIFRKTNRIANYDLEQIFNYLIDKKALSATELNYASDSLVIGFPAIIRPKYTRTECEVNVIPGEFVADYIDVERREVDVLTVSLPRRENYLKSIRYSVEFSRNASEASEAFYVRCRKGNWNVEERQYGSVLPLDVKTAILLETANGIRIKTSIVIPNEQNHSIEVQSINNSDNERKKTYILSSEIDTSKRDMLLRIVNRDGLFLRSIKLKNDKIADWNMFRMISSTKKNLDLLNAAKTNNLTGMIVSVLEGGDINAKDPENGFSVMHWIAHNASHEAFALLTLREEELEAMRAVFFSALDRKYGTPQLAFESWQKEVANFNPLCEDNDGYLPSGRFQGVNLRGQDVQSRSIRGLWEAVMSNELRTATHNGIDYFELLARSGKPVFPGLEL